MFCGWPVQERARAGTAGSRSTGTPQKLNRSCNSMWRFPPAALVPMPGKGPYVLSATDFPKDGEPRLPIGSAELT
jgi:hypothetical protein